jgi:hypothetical protein
LLPGNYTGMFRLSGRGTPDHPIVFRALPNTRVTIRGGVELAGQNNWLWGVEVTDPSGISTWTDGVRLGSPGARLINSVIHNVYGKNAIGAWLHGSGQVVYGNIVYENGLTRGAGIYTQNNFELDGYKYFIGNMFMDCLDDAGGSCFHVHGFTAATQWITGFFLKDNVFKNGRFLLGGYGQPSDRHMVKKNYFYQSGVQIGYRRPAQAKFKKNYLVDTTLSVQWFWGEGETQYTQKQPNMFTSNEIYRPTNGVHVKFVTSAYLASGRCEGCPRIRSRDTFNGNKYSVPFIASFWADNHSMSSVNLQQWRAASASAGNAMDTVSNEVGMPNKNKIVVIPNEYEGGRGHIVVYNWEHSTSVSVGLKSIARAGATVKVFDAKNPYGTPVFSGVYQGSVNLPMAGLEFRAFLVQVQ